MSDTMIERLARALHRAYYGSTISWEENTCGESVTDSTYVLFTNMARAALTEMRQPTEAMLAAGGEYDDGRDVAAVIWRAMIDAALAEEG